MVGSGRSAGRAGLTAPPMQRTLPQRQGVPLLGGIPMPKRLSLATADEQPLAWPPAPGDGRGYKVLFINPPSIPYNQVVRALASRSHSLSQVVAMPMGILYLSAVLERALPGIEIRIVDIAKALRAFATDPDRTETTLEEFTSRALAAELPADFVPDYVGISILFSTAHRSTGHIADAVKARWAGAPIVVGGMHATNAVESLLSMPSIDYVCRGEAETTITEFTKRARSGHGEAIPGIIGREKLAAAKARGESPRESAPLVHELDTIPLPAWHLIPMSEYAFSERSRARKIDEIEQDGEATIVTTRGCPFLCTFCASWTVHGREMRYRTVENVLEELRILHHRFGISTVIPEDDLFTVKKPRILSLCKAVTDEFKGELHFQFPNGLSVATLDDDVIKAMIGMGMAVANIAIESGSAYVQRHVIKKNCNLERARRVVQSCRDNGAVTRAYFILGFPGETRAQIEETVHYSTTIASDWNIYSPAAPLIGTEMFAQLLERGEIDHTFNWDDAFFSERTFDTPEISAQDLKDLAYAANLENNFFGNYNLRHGHYERAIGLFTDILHIYRGHLAAQYCIALAHRALHQEAEFEQAIESCHAQLAPTNPDPLPRTLYDKYRSRFALLSPPWADLQPVRPPALERLGLPSEARQVV